MKLNFGTSLLAVFILAIGAAAIYDSTVTEEERSARYKSSVVSNFPTDAQYIQSEGNGWVSFSGGAHAFYLTTLLRTKALSHQLHADKMIMNLLFSCSANEDRALIKQGHIFAGTAKDSHGSGVNVFVNKEPNSASDSLLKGQLEALYYRVQKAGLETSGVSVSEDVILEMLDQLSKGNAE